MLVAAVNVCVHTADEEGRDLVEIEEDVKGKQPLSQLDRAFLYQQAAPCPRHHMPRARTRVERH